MGTPSVSACLVVGEVAAAETGDEIPGAAGVVSVMGTPATEPWGGGATTAAGRGAAVVAGVAGVFGGMAPDSTPSAVALTIAPDAG